MKAPTIAPATYGTVETRVSAGEFVVTETTHRPNFRIERHAHAEAAVTLVLRGAFEERFGHRPMECQRNGLLIKPPGEAHTNRYSRDGARSLLIHVPVLALGRFGKAARVYDSVRYLPYGAANRLAMRAAREIREGDDAAALATRGNCSLGHFTVGVLAWCQAVFSRRGRHDESSILCQPCGESRA